MTIQKRRLASGSAAMLVWLGLVQGLGPMLGLHPTAATFLNLILVVGTVAFMLYYRSKTIDTREKQQFGWMLLFVAVGVLISLASTWVLQHT